MTFFFLECRRAQPSMACAEIETAHDARHGPLSNQDVAVAANGSGTAKSRAPAPRAAD